VRGEENDADTFRDFYKHTGIELKRRGVTWVRLDHSGKDPTKGQRGSSSKGDDVDVVWALAKTEKGFCLRRDFSRMQWVPPTVTFSMQENPLRYRPITNDWPDGTGETASLLDNLNVPLGASSRDAATQLKAVGEGRRRQLVVAALRWRRVNLERRTHPPEPPREPIGTPAQREPESSLEPPENSGTTPDGAGEPWPF
jgi:hypothetical protein